jgi:hypothetical protein
MAKPKMAALVEVGSVFAFSIVFLWIWSATSWGKSLAA